MELNETFRKWFDGTYTVAKTGTVRDRGNRKVTAEQVSSTWVALQKSIMGWAFVSADDIDGYIQELLEKANQPTSEEEEKEEDTRPDAMDWVTDMLDYANEADGDTQAGFTFSPDFTEIRRKFNGITRAATFDSVYNWLILENDKAYHYDKSVLKASLCELFELMQTDMAGKIMKKIVFNPDCVSVLDEFIDKVFIPQFGIVQDPRLVSVTLKHWMWIVKRRLQNLPVVDHLMLNMYGGTGLGKSAFEMAFVKVFGNFVVPQMTFGKLLDSTREIKKLTDNYVLLFEELAINTTDEKGVSLKKDDLNTLKAVISGDRAQTRVMGGQQQNTSSYSFACLGSSNTHLYDTPLFDETTMRRYFEYDCSAKARTKDDYKVMDSWMARCEELWAGVDEHLETGYLKEDRDLFKRVSDIQKSYYPTNSTTANWISVRVEGPGGNSKSRRTGEQAYKMYNKWCRDTGRLPKSMPNWMEDIRHIAPELITSEGIVSVLIRLAAL